MAIYWDDDFMFEKQGAHAKGGTPGKGKTLAPLSPFKGVCQHCKKRTIVRYYPWSTEKWVGSLCKHCIEEFDNALSEVCYNDPEY